MLKRKRRSGFALWELLLIMVIIGAFVVGFGLIGGVVMGNYWVGEKSALKAVRVEDPSMAELVTLERHVWGYSRVVVKDEEGNEQTFLLDADVLQNVTAMPADE